MKAIILITAIISFQISSIFAGNTLESAPSPNTANEVCIECPLLSPVVPMEASYEDQKDVTTLMQEDLLVPEIPMEADFTDEENQTINHERFSPVVPEEADFEKIQ